MSKARAKTTRAFTPYFMAGFETVEISQRQIQLNAFFHKMCVLHYAFFVIGGWF